MEGVGEGEGGENRESGEGEREERGGGGVVDGEGVEKEGEGVEGEGSGGGEGVEREVIEEDTQEEGEMKHEVHVCDMRCVCVELGRYVKNIARSKVRRVRS